jgi:mono/diheme cytochrome c family protein
MGRAVGCWGECGITSACCCRGVSASAAAGYLRTWSAAASARPAVEAQVVGWPRTSMQEKASADYSGRDFGAAFPIVKGLWASNISRVIPAMSDAALERLLREGVHPDREIYVMPSKQTQFLSERDMAALIAFLRTIPPVGEATPVPPAGFEAAVTARLPNDYWRTLQEGERRGYHNAAEEVAYFAAHQPPDLGPQLARGRMIASSLCSSCHGAALDGLGEPAGDIQGALAYDEVAFDRLLTESIDRTGKRVAVEWGFGHEAQPLSAAERRDVIAYVRALAHSRER